MRLYFLAILTPDSINLLVRQYKEWMREHFNSKAALKSPAHITLVPPFKLEPALENDLKKTLDDFSSNIHSFPLSLRNFSCFPPRVIFVQVAESKALSNVHEHLNRHLTEKKLFDTKAAYSNFTAHITVATRDLACEHFDRAWSHFRGLTFTADFTAEGIALLRNTPGRWDVIHVAPFQDTKVL